jgi:4-hydroxy-3-polyprenylbenzoate decarboxylase
MTHNRLIVAITGATGVIYGVRLLQMLQDTDVETHLIMSKWATRTLLHETTYSAEDVQQLASRTYPLGDQGASISSGSFLTRGMVVVPCSMRTLSAIAHGHGDNLIHRAADVILKERRKLVLVAREAPVSDIHLENMLKLSRMGVVICPPVPAFYHRPQTIDDLINYTVVRILDQFDIHLKTGRRWDGLTPPEPRRKTDGSGAPDPADPTAAVRP